MFPARFLALLLGLILFRLAVSGPAMAAALIEGSFLATTDCPAYASKAQKTNPNEIRLVPGRIYPVTEVNFKEAPDAFRLDIKGANPKDRWVLGDCGEFPPKSKPSEVAARFAARRLAAEGVTGVSACPNPPPSKDPCRACGKAVYAVLALNWLPGVCEALKGKPERPPECQGLDAGAYGARNLTLGELRPALNKCRKAAGFCGSIDKEVQPHSAYPEIKLSDATRKALIQVLPAILANSGEERHQWFKHGTCSGLPENSYFSLLADLTRQINDAGIGQFLAENQGKKIRREDFFKKVEEVLGKNARKHVNIECGKDGKALTGVQFYLPPKLLPGLDLREILAKGPGAGARGNCASKFAIPALAAD